MAFDFIPTIPAPVHISEFMTSDLMRAGVYFLYHKDELVYVGQTRTLKLRLDAHLGDRRKVFDSVAFIPCTIDRLTEIEGHYIRKHAPEYNNCGAARMSRMIGRSRPAPRYVPSEMILVDAEEVEFNLYEAAEFLLVPESDLANWKETGLLPDFGMVTLLHFARSSRRLVDQARKAAEKAF